MSNTVALAEEVPGANKYFQKAEDREKAYAKREKKPPVFKYYPKKVVKVEKEIVGPGYLKDLEASYNLKSLRKKTPDPAQSKQKRDSYFHVRAQSTRYVPGVGAYKDTDRAFHNHIVWHKDRTPHISKYNFTRFTESVAKDKQWVPGPGSYNIIPYSKNPDKKA